MKVRRNPSFHGSDYDPELDEDRLQNHLDRIREWCLSQDRWVTTAEISEATGIPPTADISRRLRHLRDPENGLHFVPKRRREGDERRGVFEYHVHPAGTGSPPKATKRELAALALGDDLADALEELAPDHPALERWDAHRSTRG